MVKKIRYRQNVYLKIFEGVRKKIGNGSSKRGGGGVVCPKNFDVRIKMGSYFITIFIYLEKHFLTYLVKKKDQSTFYRYDNLKVREGFTGIKIIKRVGGLFLSWEGW